jgi:hypothetical protein
MRFVPLALGFFACAATAAGAPAADEAPPPANTRTVVPGPHYRAGSLHRFVFGDHYRSLWTTPLPAEVIDLATFSGGLTPRRKGGGRQTRALKLQGADGRQWKFRSLDKDPSAVLPPELRDTFVDAIVQDQISAANPAGPLVVDALSAAAGIPYVPHRVVILPDDPALGEFRKEFGGLVGLLEEEIELKGPVTPGFEAYSRIVDTVELWERLDEHPEEKVDARAYLRARLFDIFLGDFDRHKDQWQWARPRDGETWVAVPEDRDQAFAKYDGLALWLIRPAHPDLVDFDETYPRIFGLTWTGRYLDRRHLSELEWGDWEAVVQDLQARLSDAAIDDAITRLPAEHLRVGGEALAVRLKGRRNELPRAARSFYRLLAQEVEVHGTNAVEAVEVAPGEDGTVRVTIAGEDGQTRFRRHFRPRETSEVRLHLKGGDDRVVRAHGTDDITVRVVGGSGNDVVDDTRAGHTRVYDAQGANRVLRGSSTRFDQRPYTSPNDTTGQPARDWGRTVMGMPTLSGGGDLGLFVGGRVSLVGYGFRKHPFSYTHTVRGGYATALSAIQAEYEGVKYRANSRTHGRLVVRGSQIDVLRFYGLGNDTTSSPGEDFFRVEQNHLSIAPSVHFGVRDLDVEVGAIAKRATTSAPGETFVGQTRPYGVGTFSQAGLRTRLTLGQRDLARTTSAYLWTGGVYYPKVWDVDSGFGNVEAQAAVFVSPARVALSPQLGFRIGAKKVFGTFPFHESAFIGGPEHIRGLRPQRYAGDASAFGSAELHVKLADIRVLLPTELGVMGFGDIGRVWVEGQSSDTWHKGVGGGLWLAPLKRSASLAVALARSEGLTRFYIQAGFGF